MNSKRVNRRTALKAAGAITAGAALGFPLSGCQTTAGELHPRLASQSLPPVHVATDRVIRVVTGLRPYRPDGFVIRPEKFDAKWVVHNYGHGGGGVTLSWGSAEIAVEKVLEIGSPGPIAVLGCGVIGLSTAIRLQERGFIVTIYARDLPPNTTSNIAAASWYPSNVVDEARRTPEFMDQFSRVARISHHRFQQLIGDDYGVYWREQYFFADQLTPDPWQYEALPDLVPHFRYLPPGTHPFPRPHVFVETMMFMEMPTYLRALMRDFHQRGGTINVRDFGSVRDVLALAENLIVNCTGLGAKELFDDRQMTPLKGQLVVGRESWII